MNLHRIIFSSVVVVSEKRKFSICHRIKLSSYCRLPPRRRWAISINLRYCQNAQRCSNQSGTFFLAIFHSFFSVADVVAPVFLSCPSDIRANLGINSSVLVNWTIPVAVDNSNMAPQISVSPPGVAPPYTFYNNTNVVYTAKDPSGNKRKCSFKVLLEGA